MGRNDRCPGPGRLVPFGDSFRLGHVLPPTAVCLSAQKCFPSTQRQLEKGLCNDANDFSFLCSISHPSLSFGRHFCRIKLPSSSFLASCFYRVHRRLLEPNGIAQARPSSGPGPTEHRRGESRRNTLQRIFSSSIARKVRRPRKSRSLDRCMISEIEAAV